MQQHHKIVKNEKKAANVPGSLILKKQFSDFEEYAHTIKNWNLEARQIGPGSFQGDLMQINAGPILLTQIALSHRLEWYGDPPPGAWTFGIPIEMESPALWRGKELVPGVMTALSKGKEFAGVSPAGFRTILLSVSEELLSKICQNLKFPELRDMTQDAELLTGPVSKISALRQTVQQFIHEAASLSSDQYNHWLSGELLYEIPELILKTVSALEPSKKRPLSASRSKALKKAETYIMDFADEPARVHDICQAAGVSMRTLEFAFVEKYGVTPKTYLEAYRLNAVRKMLRLADPANTYVADVANRWGFWHMGKFARDYRTLFGELPSQTMGQAR